MAYGFNDDKSKVEVYSKSDFVVCTGTATSVPPLTKKVVSVSGKPQGYDASKYVVLSIEQNNPNRTTGWVSAGGHLIHDANLTLTDTTETCPRTETSGSLLMAHVYNESSATADIAYRITLLKIQ